MMPKTNSPTETTAAAPSSPPRVQMSGIAKRYGLVTAITHADLEVKPGSVHALVGENGAGKSTRRRAPSRSTGGRSTSAPLRTR